MQQTRDLRIVADDPLRTVADDPDPGDDRAGQPDDGGLVKIRMRISVSGVTHGIRDLARGQIVEVPAHTAAGYVANGYAEYTLRGAIGRAYKPD